MPLPPPHPTPSVGEEEGRFQDCALFPSVANLPEADGGWPLFFLDQLLLMVRRPLHIHPPPGLLLPSSSLPSPPAKGPATQSPSPSNHHQAPHSQPHRDPCESLRSTRFLWAFALNVPSACTALSEVPGFSVSFTQSLSKSTLKPASPGRPWPPLSLPTSSGCLLSLLSWHLLTYMFMEYSIYTTQIYDVFIYYCLSTD